MSGKVLVEKRNANREAIMEAYRFYVQAGSNPNNNAAAYLMGVVRQFALVKTKHLDHDFLGSETAQDRAQDVALAVWQHLGKFEGTPESFYSWINRIAFTKAADGFNELHGDSKARVALLSQAGEDGDGYRSTDGTGFEEDNPEMVNNAALTHREQWSEKADDKGNPGWTYGEETVQGSETSLFATTDVPYIIPNWVRGEDLRLCNLLMRGIARERIARIMGITKNAVDQRLKKMKQRVEREGTQRPKW